MIVMMIYNYSAQPVGSSGNPLMVGTADSVISRLVYNICIYACDVGIYIHQTESIYIHRFTTTISESLMLMLMRVLDLL